LRVSIENRAKLACLIAGAVWGLFWIPLRAITDTGVSALWATSIFFLVPALCAAPLLALRWRRVLSAGIPFQITVAASGAALALYSTSIVFTDVVRALMLFYMMPVWSILLGKIILGEGVTPLRLLSIALAIAGMMIMFGLGVRFPMPHNTGDWMGLAAGALWAITMVRVRAYPQHDTLDLTAGFFLWGAVFALGAALLVTPAQLPTLTQIGPVLPMLVAFMLCLAMPSTYASLWGPKHLNPGVAGLLFMPEVVIGVASAALLAGEPFGAREGIGVMLIIAASLLDTASSFRRRAVQP
jgi:drug/metabolite transporter (DMT)-like permease